MNCLDQYLVHNNSKFTRRERRDSSILIELKCESKAINVIFEVFLNQNMILKVIFEFSQVLSHEICANLDHPKIAYEGNGKFIYNAEGVELNNGRDASKFIDQFCKDIEELNFEQTEASVIKYKENCTHIKIDREEYQLRVNEETGQNFKTFDVYVLHKNDRIDEIITLRPIENSPDEFYFNVEKWENYMQLGDYIKKVQLNNMPKRY